MGVFRILSDKSVERKLRQELAEAWPEVDERISLERLEKLPYLTAVIKESLRLSHGVVSPLPRIVPHETRIGDVVVPQSTIVGMGQSFVHLNPDIFPNPKAFDPSRWLGENTSDLESYLVPFSKGPRSCLGLNLAWAELYLILGTLFRKVDLELFETLPSDFDWGAFLVPRYHGTLRVKHRVGSALFWLFTIHDMPLPLWGYQWTFDSFDIVALSLGRRLLCDDVQVYEGV
ncbi:hypothetical protein H1R20_g8587, partial [Candolleomyces eurysporus]